MRQNAFRLAILILLVTAAVKIVPAQEKIITEAELDAVIERSDKKIEKIKYRVTTIGESNDFGERISKNINEYLPPDRERRVIESQTERGVDRHERVTIGKKSYVRFDNEDWQVEGSYGTGAGSGSGAVYFKEEVTRVIQYKGKNIINGKTTDFYEDKTVTVTKLPVNNWTKTEITHYWFDEEGRILKSESERREDKTDRFRHNISEYDYDADIKIEAPVIKRAVKKTAKKSNPK